MFPWNNFVLLYTFVFSNVWLCKENNGKLLFNMIDNLVDSQLIKQKHYICNNIPNNNENNDSKTTVLTTMIIIGIKCVILN